MIIFLLLFFVCGFVDLIVESLEWILQSDKKQFVNVQMLLWFVFVASEWLVLRDFSMQINFAKMISGTYTQYS